MLALHHTPKISKKEKGERKKYVVRRNAGFDFLLLPFALSWCAR